VSTVLHSLGLLPEAQHTRQKFLQFSVEDTCHVSGGESSASHGGGPCSFIVRSMWGLWWTRLY